MLLMALGQFFVVKKNPANLILIGLLFLCCIWLTHATWSILGLASNFPHINKTHVPFFCLSGPMWFLYIKCLFEKYTPQKRDYLYVIPSLICVLLSIPFYSQSAEFKNSYIEIHLYDFTTVSIYIATRIAEFTVITSLIVSIVYLRRLAHRSQANIDLKTLNLIMAMTVTALIAALIRLMGSVFNSHTYSVIVPCAIICVAFVVLYFLSHRYPVLLSLGYSAPRVKVCDQQTRQTLKRYRQQITIEKWYLDPDIKLQQLAKLLKTQPHRLSELVNTSSGKNFNGFINEFRIEHAKIILLNEPSRSILDIAFASGFNSKSAFYKHFTQCTSMTPSEFRKSNMHSHKISQETAISSI